MSELKDKTIKQKKKKKSQQDKKPSKLVVVFRTLKSIWSNKQYKATIKLSLYFIFFIAVLIVVQVSNQISSNRNIVIKTPLERFGEITNYTYKFIIDNGIAKTEVNGTHNEVDEMISIADKNYQIINNKVYLNINGINTESLLPFTIDITRLTPSNMEMLINKSEEISVTNYKSGEEETTYSMPVIEFEKIINNKIVTSNETITISKKELKNEITGFAIELSSNYLLLNPTSNVKRIELTYNKK